MAQHYCYKCGSPLSKAYPADDDRLRELCLNCGWVFYENPKIQVAVVAVNRGRILWIKRATEPRAGFWGLPGGFMELDESPREAAAREAREETGIDIDPKQLDLYLVGSVGTVNQVYILFRAEYESEQIELGPEAMEAQWFDEQDAPWDQLAYPEITRGLRQTYQRARDGIFGIYYVEHKDGESIE